MSEKYAVQVNHLSKTFNQKKVVDDISFNIKPGEIFALLGPNGAGKTTTFRIMTTLLKPTSGSITIMGYDTQKEPQKVRSLFGLTSKDASIDKDLSARENLMIFARLNGLSRKDAKVRTEELLTEFSLINSADKALSTFSGGMRRRLDLAVSLIARPAVIFLDEPTTGLDPQTRIQMWDTIRDLVKAGSTIILTTQYLEEADQLADHIAMIDHGKMVGYGTPNELKAKVGNEKLNLKFEDENQAEKAVQSIQSDLKEKVQQNGNSVVIPISDINEVPIILHQLTQANLKISDLNVKQPSMDDVFFAMTVGKN
ncbi:ATP-binding cassette domain-containing protein [Lactobacillus sanfranciscensis]|nr:ATP-binding cassette domain-containing protein [Fructilactobacillus sanfranciscensis]NDR76187.1 ATP-binding cassette domain-containing protein [Fructilactobacillus sanfranciscensis]NDR96880.1 ATP-binding cassette domain-containing protein [Fructilactobacillus sanfranciscensis]NDS04693.1 ATP-binding cassette domain-containing protein [Fructilactobacillus sanfranciscensis]